MSKCPQCGYKPPMGRPKEVDDIKVHRLLAKGLTFRAVSEELGISLGAVHAASQRPVKKGKRSPSSAA